MSDRAATLPRAKAAARRGLHRVDNEELRKLRGIVHRLRSGPLDVLYLGDSTARWTAPYDADQRPLSALVGAELVGRSYHAVNGGSYNAELLAAFVAALNRTGLRPAVLIVPLWPRGRLVPWIEHPVFNYRQAIARMYGVTRTTPTHRIRAAIRRPEPGQFEAYYRVPHPTLVGDLTIGDYVGPLKDPNHPWTPERSRERLIYSYHHGALISRDPRGLAAAEALGRAAREMGSRVVVYQTPLSVETGVSYLGPAFRDIVTTNFQDLDAAFWRGWGYDCPPVLATGTALPPEHYIDPSLADEHLNQNGRAALARPIVEAVVQG